MPDFRAPSATSSTSAAATVPAVERAVSRRTVVTAAAWTLPVVAVAVATPLAAASDLTATLDLVPAFGQPSNPTNVKAVPLSVKVFDQNGVDDWTGSFDLEVFFTPDDSVIYVVTGVSNPQPSAASIAAGWAFTGWGTPGPNGVYSAKYQFSGTILNGDSAQLVVDTNANPVEFFTFERVGSPAAPFSTIRTVTISNVAGVPNTDQTANNSTPQAITYSW